MKKTLFFICSLALWHIGCQLDSPTESALSALDKGSLPEAQAAIQKWQQKDTNIVAPIFLSALVHFANGSADSLAIARTTVLTSLEKRQKLLEWAAKDLKPNAQSATQFFLLGLLKEVENKPSEAIPFFEKAAAFGNILPAFRQHIEMAMNPNVHLELFVPKDMPIEYVGTMKRNLNNMWIPAGKDFKIKSGRLVSRLGKKTYSADFGGTTVLCSDKDSAYYWAPLLTKGQVLVRLAVPNSPGKEIAVTPKIAPKLHRIPVDFWGKIVLLDVDASKNQTMPVVIIPNRNTSSDCSAVAVVGNYVPTLPNDFKHEASKSKNQETCFCWSEDGSMYNADTESLSGFTFGGGGISFFGSGICIAVEKGLWWGKVENTAFLK